MGMGSETWLAESRSLSAFFFWMDPLTDNGDSGWDL